MPDDPRVRPSTDPTSGATGAVCLPPAAAGMGSRWLSASAVESDDMDESERTDAGAGGRGGAPRCCAGPASLAVGFFALSVMKVIVLQCPLTRKGDRIA